MTPPTRNDPMQSAIGLPKDNIRIRDDETKYLYWEKFLTREISYSHTRGGNTNANNSTDVFEKHDIDTGFVALHDIVPEAEA